MNWLSKNRVAELGFTENEFLEVLLTRFSLSRRGGGSQLEVHFDDDTPTIWRRAAKEYVRERIPNFEAKTAEYQAELDAFLLDVKGSSYEFDDPEFPFRYASGGTLPVVRIDDHEYYCLFYREIFPIGWNIANGGCDTRKELLNPLQTVEREFREELLVLDLLNRRRYVFERDVDKPFDLPEFATARELWQARLGVDFSEFRQVDLPLKWLAGSDSVVVKAGKEAAATEGCFLNINAQDFGIEIDSVAKLAMDGDAILCDGEVVERGLVNAPIGLFPVNQFNQHVRAGARQFTPKTIFYSGRQRDGNDLDRVTSEFLAEMTRVRSERDLRDFKAAHEKYDLCPVTRRIIRRYASLQKGALAPHKPFEIFISFGMEDEDLATRAYQLLVGAGKRVFLSSQTLYPGVPFAPEIDAALNSARCLIAIATRPEHLLKPWPEFEYRNFHMDRLNGRKPRGILIPLVCGFNPVELPLPLRYYNAVVCDPRDIDACLPALLRGLTPDDAKA
jgi:hypothetical protein